MSSNPPPMPVAEVRQARRARTRTIRRRVATGAVALFLATWALIAVELVNGHDPALASRNATTVSSGSDTSTSSTGSTGSNNSSGSSVSNNSSGSRVSNNSSGSSAVSSVTTRQS